MANRHDVELIYTDLERRLLIDGKEVTGVTAVTVRVDARNMPVVSIDLVPATFRYTGSGETDLVAGVQLIEDEGADQLTGDSAGASGDNGRRPH